MKKKSKKGKVIAIVLSLGTVMAISAGLYFKSYANSRPAMVQTTPLLKSDLVNSISSSGTIESKSTTNIYSTLNYPVKEIFVKEGDSVTSGDVLAILDIESIELDIKQTQYSIQNSQATLSEESKNNNSTISNSQFSVESSKIALEKQQLNYDTLKNNFESETNTELKNAQVACQNAETTLKEKTEKYQLGQQLLEVGGISQTETNDLKTAMDNAQTAYANAVESYDLTKQKLQKDLEQSKIDLDNASITYNNSIRVLKDSKSKSTAASANNISSQKVNLEKLEQQADKSQIIATSDGIITKSNAKVGNTPSGILFVIEDMEHLQVTTDIKEFDIGQIELGQDVIIKTESTGEKELKGKVSYIAPASTNSASTVAATSAASSTNVQYETHVDIMEADSGLKIGMNARLKTIIETKPAIFAVNFDAVMNNQEGQPVIYIVEKGLAKEVPVTTGLETDIKVEIISDELTEDLEMILNPSALTPGMQVTTASNETNAATGTENKNQSAMKTQN